MGDAETSLQFDRAEYTGPAPDAACTQCGKALPDSYFEVGGRIVCPPCRDAAAAAESGGSKKRRLARAWLWGGLGAAAGAGIWVAVRAITDASWGIVAIIVGVLVGNGVKKGSDGKGGWVYQALAVFLTYGAIVITYVPMIIQGLASSPSAETSAAPAAPPAAATAEAAAAAPPALARGEAPPTVAPAPPTGLDVVVAVGVILGIAFIAPFLGGFENIIGILIIGFALFEAWRLNKRVPLVISGPFARPVVAAPAHDAAG